MALRAFKAACSTLWATTPEHLQLILEIASREHVPDHEAVAAKQARRLSGTEQSGERNGVAIIHVEGTIFRYANFFTDFSGGATVESLAQDFNAALDNPNVSAILLNIDSPGGEANGINEFAQMIYNARARKPIVAYVGGTGASAAYWIASAAHEIVADKTAILGSIGVVATVPNPDARGAKEIQIVSSQSPRKRPNPNSESGRAQLQATIDDLAEVFIDAVARNRETTADDVEMNFGRGGVFVGQKSVEAGLADRLGSFEEVVSELAAGKKPRRYKPKMAAEAAEEQDMKFSEEFKQLKARVVAAFDKSAASAQATEATETQEATNSAEEDAARVKAAEAENERLRKQLAVQREEKAKAEAEAFVAAQVAAGKIFPAEKEPTITQYLIAAEDDYLRPRAEGSRVAGLRAMIESRPAHKLTEELVVGAEHKVIGSDPTGDTQEIKPERRKKLLKMTALGQKALESAK
jgi:signal peptide peptidase SppA